MLFPTFLKLGGRQALLVGGGPVAAGKLRGLLEAGAVVKVVAPRILLDIASAPVEPAMRPFDPSGYRERARSFVRRRSAAWT